MSHQKEPPHSFSHVSLPPLSNCWQGIIYFLSLWICLFWIFHKWSRTIFTLLCLFFFMSHHILKVHSHCSIDHNFIQLFLWLNNIVCSTLVTLEDTKAIPFDIVVLLLQTRIQNKTMFLLFKYFSGDFVKSKIVVFTGRFP